MAKVLAPAVVADEEPLVLVCGQWLLKLANFVLCLPALLPHVWIILTIPLASNGSQLHNLYMGFKHVSSIIFVV